MEKVNGAEAYWILSDGSVHYTEKKNGKIVKKSRELQINKVNYISKLG
ncbi:hypothetical protein ACP4DD_02535 [Parvimonas sp. G1425]